MAASGLSYRKIARLTGVHPETARRYMQGQSPSVEFVTSFCAQLGVSPAWLLAGTGPMQADQVREHALRHTRAGELLGALGGVLDSLAERIERLEFQAHVPGHVHGRGHETGQAHKPPAGRHEEAHG